MPKLAADSRSIPSTDHESRRSEFLTSRSAIRLYVEYPRLLRREHGSFGPCGHLSGRLPEDTDPGAASVHRNQHGSIPRWLSKRPSFVALALHPAADLCRSELGAGRPEGCRDPAA